MRFVNFVYSAVIFNVDWVLNVENQTQALNALKAVFSVLSVRKQQQQKPARSTCTPTVFVYMNSDRVTGFQHPVSHALST